MKAVVSLDEFRKNLSDIVSIVMYGDQTVLVRKHNKTGVIVMSEKEYESLKNPRKRFSSLKVGINSSFLPIRSDQEFPRKSKEIQKN